MKAVSGGFGQAAENKVALFILMWFFYRLKIGVLVYLGEQKILMKKLIKKQW